MSLNKTSDSRPSPKARKIFSDLQPLRDNESTLVLLDLLGVGNNEVDCISVTVLVPC